MITLDLRPDIQRLRQFSITGAIVCAIWLMVFVSHDSSMSALILSATGALLGTVGIVWPRVAYVPYIVLSVVGYPIGLVVSTVLVVGLFYGVITPFGLIARWLGHDPLRRKLRVIRETNWQTHTPSDSTRYWHQF